MVGETATMAVLPQMPVPTAISVASRSGRPSRRPNQLTMSIAAGIVTRITGSARKPIAPTSTMLSPSPSRTMPTGSTPLSAKRMPGLSQSGSVKKLPSASPSSIATMMPLMAPGLMWMARENASAATLPMIANASASSRPGICFI